MSSFECGECGWGGRMPWGRECPQCHPKTDQEITYQVLAGRRDEEAVEAAERYIKGLEAQVSVLEVCVESEATRGNEAEAQVQAVRDVCNVAVHVNDHPDVAVGWLEATASVLRALDGDA